MAMTAEYFNVFVDRDREWVTARVFQKHYKGLVINVPTNGTPMEGHEGEVFETLKRSALKALEQDFIENKDTIIKWLSVPLPQEKEKEFEKSQAELEAFESKEEVCLACQ